VALADVDADHRTQEIASLFVINTWEISLNFTFSQSSIKLFKTCNADTIDECRLDLGVKLTLQAHYWYRVVLNFYSDPAAVVTSHIIDTSAENAI
jgi:hypothetical protein